MRSVRWDAAAMTVIGEVMPYCMCRLRSQALSKPMEIKSLVVHPIIRKLYE
jgi:hypothetical protein